jgi:hypothetical protein
MEKWRLRCRHLLALHTELRVTAAGVVLSTPW